MPLDYPREQCWRAVHTLVTGNGRIQERLQSAALCIHALRPRDFPESLCNEFEDLRRELTREKPIGDEGALAATIRNLSDQHAANFAERILSLYTHLRGGI
jgi:hypothetical protein